MDIKNQIFKRRKNNSKFSWKRIVVKCIINELLFRTGSHIRDKVKVVLDVSNYATKKELDHVPGVDTPDLASKKYFIALKAEVDKLDINKLANVSTSLNNLKVDDLDVGELKTVPINFLRNIK